MQRERAPAWNPYMLPPATTAYPRRRTARGLVPVQRL
jgi:hypothetical protein